jgi:hypothetical protein
MPTASTTNTKAKPRLNQARLLNRPQILRRRPGKRRERPARLPDQAAFDSTSRTTKPTQLALNSSMRRSVSCAKFPVTGPTSAIRSFNFPSFAGGHFHRYPRRRFRSAWRCKAKWASASVMCHSSIMRPRARRPRRNRRRRVFLRFSHEPMDIALDLLNAPLHRTRSHGNRELPPDARGIAAPLPNPLRRSSSRP